MALAGERRRDKWWRGFSPSVSISQFSFYFLLFSIFLGGFSIFSDSFKKCGAADRLLCSAVQRREQGPPRVLIRERQAQDNEWLTGACVPLGKEEMPSGFNSPQKRRFFRENCFPEVLQFFFGTMNPKLSRLV